uniref:Uncharacterized protein n=1 Tax=Biomphalaria glabrata TaxID=6526 RepID=A0A2C9KP52_BIOGL
MSSYLTLADIASKLHSLEDIEKSLQKLIAEIQAAKKIGETWLQTRDESTYTEIKEFLVGRTSEILQTCFSVGSQSINQSSETTTLQTVEDGESATVSAYEGKVDISENVSVMYILNCGTRTGLSAGGLD